MVCKTGLVPLVVESDVEVVGFVNDNSLIGSDIGLVIDGNRFLIRNMYGCTLTYFKKKTNFIAHTLAKLALSSDEDRVWLEKFPPCV